MEKNININTLLGKIISKIEIDEEDRGWDVDIFMTFFTSDGNKYQFYHEQDCCEIVYLAETIGDLDDLLWSPILEAEEISSEGYDGEVEEDDDKRYFEWAFYKLSTIKGNVTLRFFGKSNGYYSVNVDFRKIAL